ncbi:hypothetical protein HMPREF1210_00994 [Paenisporosarcina sp. HGH0030]|nr:hypothetical protein HMPREF1210_00994 [Paenisporosarcina sp. HGH0030]
MNVDIKHKNTQLRGQVFALNIIRVLQLKHPLVKKNSNMNTHSARIKKRAKSKFRPQKFYLFIV